MTSTLPTARPLARIIRSVATMEGADMPVRRAFAAHGGVFVDPFLMLDHFGPTPVTPESQGFPPHPHRGFETVTYLFSGAIEHKDSVGGHAVIHPGDAQWMTAGSGIVHSETLPASLKATGGALEGLQLWVNLPRALKNTKPGHQYVPAAELPTFGNAGDGVQATVIAGTVLGVTGPVIPQSRLSLAFITLHGEATVSLSLPADEQAAVYVVSGSVAAGRERQHVEQENTAVFAPGDGPVVLAALEPARLLYMTGVPLNEPVVARGPFVMTTEGDIRQAMLDYSAGKFGAVAG